MLASTGLDPDPGFPLVIRRKSQWRRRKEICRGSLRTRCWSGDDADRVDRIDEQGRSVESAPHPCPGRMREAGPASPIARQLLAHLRTRARERSAARVIGQQGRQAGKNALPADAHLPTARGSAFTSESCSIRPQGVRLQRNHLSSSGARGTSCENRRNPPRSARASAARRASRSRRRHWWRRAAGRRPSCRACADR
jgi:hypothetical protein